MNTIRIMLVDDHPVVRAGFRRLLEVAEDVRVVGESGEAELVTSLYRELDPNVVVMDLSMPGMGGLEALRRLLAHHPQAQVLIFSMHDQAAMVDRALQSGARGYVSKHSAPSVLLEAIRQVAAGELYVEQGLSERGLAAGNGALSALTQREFEVFRLLAEGNPVAKIAEILCISPKTAGVHHTNIMNKLKLENAVQLVRLALSEGVIRDGVG